MWQYDYQDVLEMAAKAGDAESAYKLVILNKDNWSISQRGNEVTIFGSDHYRKERDYLMLAVESRDPRAQKILGRHLMRGHPDFGYGYYAGLKLWLAGIIGELFTQRKQIPSLRDRLLPLANTVKLDDLFNVSCRCKITYHRTRDKVATCGLRFYQDKEQGTHVVLEQLPKVSIPSVMNAAEEIATKVVYTLLLSGVDVIPDEIHWYNAFPITDTDRGSLHRVIFCWDEVVYSDPQIELISVSDVPVDLSDILGVKI